MLRCSLPSPLKGSFLYRAGMYENIGNDTVVVCSVVTTEAAGGRAGGAYIVLQEVPGVESLQPSCLREMA